MRSRPAAWVLATVVLAASPSAANGPRADRERYEPRSFLGYACRDDCRRHKAGFAWAARRALARPADCAALQGAESEGCRAFVEEGLAPEAAGRRWALENEVSCARDCAGAGVQFGRGCLRALPPWRPMAPGCAEAWPDRGEAFPGARPRR